MQMFKIGCVADDFTGASDIASFFRQAGLETLLINELPAQEMEIPNDIDCIVIALKTRTIEPEEAVRQSLEAFRWLDDTGCQKLYFKYCSTFDSTAKGNIGPVIDAVMETFQIPYALVCPSLPVNGRTVKNGYIYVNHIPLHESHMKDHPLTPMQQSDIPGLLKGQGKYSCRVVTQKILAENGRMLAKQLKAAEQPCYLVPDYYQDEHGLLIAEAFSECRFFSGGSGLGGALAQVLGRTRRAVSANYPMDTEGRGLVLAGSCSAVTLKQIADYQNKLYPSYRIDPQRLITGTETVSGIWNWVEDQTGTPLIYSSAGADEIVKNQQYGKEKIALAIEKMLSALAVMAVKAGRTRIIVAGGETSGAVTKALGFQSFYISESLAPGVPVMIPAAAPQIRLVLKSGNFGQTDFFDRAVVMSRKEEPNV